MFKLRQRFANGNTATMLRENRGFIVDHIASFAILNICNGIYLAGLLRFMGFSDSVNGLVLAIPVLGGLFQIVGPILLAGVKNQKKYIVLGTFVGKLCLGLIFFIPVLLGRGILGSLLMVAIFSIGHGTLAMIAPAMGNWVMISLRPDRRSAFFSLRERLGLAAIALATMIASALLDLFAEGGVEQVGFLLIGASLVTIAFFDLIALKKVECPDSNTNRSGGLKSLLMMVMTKDMFKVLLLTILWQFSCQIWIPHNSIYILNGLGVSYSLMGVMGIVCSVEKIFVMVLWSRYTSRTSYEHSFFASLFFFASCGVFWLILTPENAQWLIIIQQLYSSIAWAVLGVALFNVQYDTLTGEKVLKMGIVGGISGIAGFGFSLLGSIIIEVVDNNGGIIGLSGQKTVISIGSIVGFILMIFLYFGFIPKDKRPRAKNLLMSLITFFKALRAANMRRRGRRYLR